MKVKSNLSSLNFLISIGFLYLNISPVFSLKLKTFSQSNSKSESNLQSKLKMTTKYCNSLCTECSINDLNYCTICQPGVIFYKYNCISKCPDGTYFNDEWRSCKQCHPDCPICWGPQPDMCGSTLGVKSQIVLLDKEIKDFLTGHAFTKREIDNWFMTLKIILSKDRNIIKDFGEEVFSPNDIYNTDRIEAQLPIGSFSEYGGVFIPVPSYFTKNKELVNSHWVFKKGMWDGKRWVQQFFPRLPTFIKFKGEKSKIYIENKGYWIWDQMKDWFWIPIGSNKLLPQTSVEEELAVLNSIKINVSFIKNKFKKISRGITLAKN
jgi:hypothetical protein